MVTTILIVDDTSRTSPSPASCCSRPTASGPPLGRRALSGRGRRAGARSHPARRHDAGDGRLRRLTAQLRADPRTHDYPVIFVTAMDNNRGGRTRPGLRRRRLHHQAPAPAIVLAGFAPSSNQRQAGTGCATRTPTSEAGVGRHDERNQVIQEVSIHALARLAETRDPETGQPPAPHSREYVLPWPRPARSSAFCPP